MQEGGEQANAAPETAPAIHRSRWDRIVWPRWLPLRARLPLIAQITGAFALVAAVTMPDWTVGAPPPSGETLAAPVALAAPAGPVAPAAPPRPAHLNLDLRHNFRSVDLTVTVDNKRVLDTKLEGAGKKFGMFGRRADRSFTRTLDLQPGARVVRLQVKSADEKFEHSRVERFDLFPASVATMRVNIEKSGLTVSAERPAPPPPAPAPQPASAAAATTAPALPPAQAAQAAQAVAQTHQEAQKASALAELYQTLRSTLIALAGFIASVASGFMFEEYLRSRNLPFLPRDSSSSPQSATGEERRRRRRRERKISKISSESDISIDAGLS